MGNPFQDSNKTYNDDQTAVADVINVQGLNAALTVGNTAVEVKVGTSRLTGRKILTLHNASNNTIYWGFSSAVTVSNGTPIFKNQFIEWTVGDNVAIWVISTSNSNTRITEGA